MHCKLSGKGSFTEMNIENAKKKIYEITETKPTTTHSHCIHAQWKFIAG